MYLYYEHHNISSEVLIRKITYKILFRSVSLKYRKLKITHQPKIGSRIIINFILSIVNCVINYETNAHIINTEDILVVQGSKPFELKLQYLSSLVFVLKAEYYILGLRLHTRVYDNYYYYRQKIYNKLKQFTYKT